MLNTCTYHLPGCDTDYYHSLERLDVAERVVLHVRDPGTVDEDEVKQLREFIRLDNQLEYK